MILNVGEGTRVQLAALGRDGTHVALVLHPN